MLHIQYAHVNRQQVQHTMLQNARNEHTVPTLQSTASTGTNIVKTQQHRNKVALPRTHVYTHMQTDILMSFTANQAAILLQKSLKVIISKITFK